MTFGKYLRRRREERGITQSALAGELGVSDTYVSGVEAGGLMPPSLEMLTRIAPLIDEHPDVLIEIAWRTGDQAKALVESRPEVAALFRMVRGMTPDAVCALIRREVES